MREIKFRAWDSNKMHPAFTLDQLHGWDSGEVFLPDKLTRLMGLDLMQFTGLHDKNGKEIYEGDITEVGEVVWVRQRGGWMYNPSRANTDISFMEAPINHDVVEIIGNVYENPNLLTV